MKQTIAFGCIEIWSQYDLEQALKYLCFQEHHVYHFNWDTVYKQMSTRKADLQTFLLHSEYETKKSHYLQYSNFA